MTAAIDNLLLRIWCAAPSQWFYKGGAKIKTPAATKVTTSAPDKRNFIEINHSRRGFLGGKVTPKSKGLVLENTFGSAVTTSTVSEVLSRPDFLDASVFGRAYGFGRDGLVRKAGRTAEPVFSTSRPPAALENAASGFESRSGAEIMTTFPVASRCAAPAIQATTEETRAFALLQATSDATMAKLYLSRGNVPAARRKAVQLLKALQVLEAA